MSGHRDVARTGQLALMDALVFFTVAMLISSILLSRAYLDRRDETDTLWCDVSYDASTLLGVVLRASIGECVTLNVSGRQVTVSPTAAIGECVAMEATALLSGDEPRVFDEVNGMILEIVKDVAGPFVVPHLWVLRSEDGSWDALMRIEDRPPAADACQAASFDLPVGHIGRCRVTLVLEPSLLLETDSI